MSRGADIRAHFFADRQLQMEINRALEHFAATLPATDKRLVRILARTLEPSWVEHVGFQAEVVFPIILGRDGRDGEIDAVIDRMRSGHPVLTQHLSEVADQLHDILDGNNSDTAPLVDAVRDTRALRSSHFDDEAMLAANLPGAFTSSEVARLCAWMADRPKPTFPLGVLGWRRMRQGH